MKHLSIFCSSSQKVSPIFKIEMEKLVDELSNLDLGIVFGGSDEGTMGVMASRAKAKNIPVKGIYFGMNDQGLSKNLTQTLKASSLAERKNHFYELSDAFLIFPGGVGTLDEWMDLLAKQHFQDLKKPVILYNPLGFWESFLQFFLELYETGFLHSKPEDMFDVVTSPQELSQILQEKGWGQ